MLDAYVSTLAALGGTIVGGLTSFTTSWLIQTTQARAQRLAAERTRRDELYGRFIDAVAELYAHALSEQEVDYARLVPIMALRGRILFQSSAPVAECADRAVGYLVDVYMGPKLGIAEARALLDDGRADPMKEFAVLCREELRALR